MPTDFTRNSSGFKPSFLTYIWGIRPAWVKCATITCNHWWITHWGEPLCDRIMLTYRANKTLVNTVMSLNINYQRWTQKSVLDKSWTAFTPNPFPPTLFVTHSAREIDCSLGSQVTEFSNTTGEDAQSASSHVTKLWSFTSKNGWLTYQELLPIFLCDTRVLFADLSTAGL